MGNRTKRKFIGGTAAAVLAAALAAVILLDLLPKKTEKRSVTAVAMGSVLRIDVYGGADDTLQTAQDAVHALDGKISRTIDTSFVCRINENTVYDTDREFVGFLQTLIDISAVTDGAFDITVGGLTDLWDIEAAQPRIPAEKEIAQTLSAIGYQKIQIDGTTVSVPAGMLLDMGAAGKGMACDAIKAALERDKTVTGAVAASGGSILVYGKHPEKKSWTVGVRDPDGGENDLMGTITTAACCLSTSGNYEKYFILNGKRYCHILSPFDGYPADSGLKSVTVRAATGMQSDALSTACFVLGVGKSLPILEKFGADAVFVTDDNAVHVTEGLRRDFEITNTAYHIADFDL